MPSRFFATNHSQTHNIFEVVASDTSDATVFRNNSGGNLLVIDAQLDNLSIHSNMTMTAPLRITNTTAASAVGTGSLIVDGGMSTAGSHHVGGVLHIHNTTAASAAGTGSLIVDGGMSVAGAAFVTGLLTLGNQLDAANHRLVNLATPTLPTDAVTKEYVDTYVSGMSVKQTVLVATTGPLTLSGLVAGSVVDNVTLGAGDRVLVKDQADAVENGIYTIASGGGSPVRSSDFATGMDVSGAYVLVDAGTLNRSNGWIVQSGNEAIVGTDPLTFFQFTSTGDIVAGDAMTKTGNRLDVVADGVSIEVSADALRLATGAAGTGLSGGSGVPLSINANLSHVTGLGTIGTGTWQANAVGVAYGGTGATTFATNHVLLGNGTGALQTNANLTFANSILSTSAVSVSGLLRTATAGTLTAALDASGQFFSVAASTFTDASSPETTSVPSFRGSFFGTPTYTSANSGVVVQDAATVYIDNAPVVSGSASFDRAWSLLVGNGNVGVRATTDSTSVSSGALVVDGGIGVARSLTVGSNVTVGNRLVLYDPTNVRGVLSGPTVDNALYLAKNFVGDTDRVALYSFGQTEFYTGGLIGAQVLRMSINASGIVQITSTSVATSTSTGAFRVAGGVGIAGALHVGSTALVHSTIASTSTTTGALTVAGGVGIAENVWIGGSLYLPNSSVGIVLSTSDGTMVARGRWSIARGPDSTLDMRLPNDVAGAAFTISTYNVSSVVDKTWFTLDAMEGHVHLSSTIEATSLSTGALVIDGGISIAKDVLVGGNIAVSDQGITLGNDNDVVMGMVSDDFVIENASGNIVLQSAGDVVISTTGVTMFTGGIGGTRIVAGYDYTGAGLLGQYLNIGSHTTTLEQASTTSLSFANIERSTLAATTAGSTVTNAASLRIAGAPIAGTNVTIDNAWALRVVDGRVYFGNTTDATSSNGSLIVMGGVSIAKTLHATSLAVPMSDTVHLDLGNVTLMRAVGTDALLSNFVLSSDSDGITRSPLRFAGPNSVVSLFGIESDHVAVHFTSDATGVDTGALIVDGGVSIAKNVHVGGRILHSPVNTYYNDNPALVIDSGATVQNIDVGALVLRVYEQADMTSTFDPRFTGRQILQTTTVSLDYTSPAWRLNDGTANTVSAPFAARFQGFVKPAYAELYNFFVTVQGGVRVWIDGTPVVTSWEQNTTATVHVGTYLFTSTTRWLPIVVEWASTSSPNRLLVEWSSASQTRQTVPASAFAYSGHETAGSVYGTMHVYGPTRFNDVLVLSGTSDSNITSSGGASFSKSVYVGTNLVQNGAVVFGNGRGITVQGTSGTASDGTVLEVRPTASTTDRALVRTFETYDGINTTFMDMGWDGTRFRLWSRRTAAGSLRDLSIGVDDTGLGKLVGYTTGHFGITSTNGSTSPTTGALVVAGGLGIGENLWVNGSLNVGTLSSGGFEFSLGYGDQVTRGDTGLSRALVKASGGILVVNYLNDFASTRVDSVMVVNNTTVSTSASTGALRVSGGLGVGGQTTLGSALVFDSTTPYIVKGVGGITGNVTDLGLYASGTVGEQIRFVTNAGAFAFYTDGDDDAGTSPNFVMDQSSVSSVLPFVVSTTTDATSTTDGGAFTVAGGGAIGGALFVGGNLTTTQTLSSTKVTATSTDADALIVAGGGTVSGTLMVGGTLMPTSAIAFQGTNPLLSMGASGLDIPTVTVRSAGTKIVLYAALTGATTDYAVGVAPNALWNSVPSGSASHVWYAGTTERLRLRGDGGLVSVGSGTFVDFQNTSGVRITGNGTGAEASISFHHDNTYTASYWTMGKGSWGVANTSVSIGSSAFGSAIMEWQSSGTVLVHGTVDATDTNNGTLVISGGVGIVKSLFVGTGVSLQSGSLRLANTVPLSFYKANATDLVPIVTLDANDRVWVNGSGSNGMYLHANGGTQMLHINYNTTGNTVIYHGTQSSVTVGSGGIVFADNTTWSSGTLVVQNTADASSVSTGALQLAGGVSITKNAWVGAGVSALSMTLRGTENGTLSMDGTALVLQGGADGIRLHGSLTFTSTTNAISTTQAGMVVAGGLSVARDTIIGNNLYTGTRGRSMITLEGDASDRRWYHLGTVDDLSGSGSLLLHMAAAGTGTYGIVETQFGARVVAGTLSAEHAFTGYSTDAFTGTLSDLNHIYIYNDGLDNYHVFVHLAEGTGVTVDVLHSSAGRFVPTLEGTGATPDGTTSGFDAWTLAYDTARNATATQRTGKLLINATTDATTTTNGGAATIAGGLSVAKTLFVGEALRTDAVQSIGNSAPLLLRYDGTTRLSLTNAGGVSVHDHILPNAAGTVDLGSNAVPFRHGFMNGDLRLLATTASTSTTTGTLVMQGGMGIVGNVYMGNELHVGNASVIDGVGTVTLSKSGGGIWYINDAATVEHRLTLSNGSNTGGASGAPSLTQGSVLHVHGGSWQDTSTATASTALGGFVGTYVGQTTLTAASANVTTPLAASLWIEGAPLASTNQTITDTHSVYIKSGKVFVGDTRDATTNSNGAIVVSGGVSVAKSLWTNKLSLPVGSLTDENDIYATTSGGVTLQQHRVATESANDVFQFIHANIAGGDKTLLSLSRTIGTLSTALIITNTTVSTGNNDGALVVSGGTHLLGDVYVQGNLRTFGSLVHEGLALELGSTNADNYRALLKSGDTLVINPSGDYIDGVSVESSLMVADTTDSASSTVAALVLGGGASVGKKLRVYGGAFVSDVVNVTNANSTVWSMDMDIGDGARGVVVSSSDGTQGVAAVTLRNANATHFWDWTSSTSGLGWTSVPLAGGSGTTYLSMDHAGFLHVRGTADAGGLSSGGTMLVSGGMRVNKSVYMGGDVFVVRNVDGGASLTVRNDHSGTNAWSQVLLRNDTIHVGMLMYNSSTRSTEGGANALTLRNNGGALRLQSSGSSGITVAATTGAVTMDNTLYVSGQATFNANMTVNGSATLQSLLLSGSTSGTTELKSPAIAGNVTFELMDALPPVANASIIVGLDGKWTYGEPLPPAGTPTGTIVSTFSGANNVTSAAINGLSYSGGMFMVLVKVDVTATSNVTAGYELRGVYMPSGSWDLVSNAIGDDIGIVFDITPAGQIRYSSPNFAGWTSTVFSWEETITGSEVINVLDIGDDLIADVDPTRGAYFNVKGGLTFTDKSTVDNGTLARWSSARLGAPVLAAYGSNVTTSVAATVTIEGDPTAGTNQTLTVTRALDVQQGVVRIGDTRNATSTTDGALQLAGGVSCAKNAVVGGVLQANGGMTVGNGTMTNAVWFGSVVVGASGSALKTVAIAFGTTLSSTNYNLTGSVCTVNASGHSWVVTFVELTTTGATANVLMLDGTSWSDVDVRVDWRLTI